MKHIIVGILLATIVSACSFKSDKQAKAIPTIDLYASTKGDTHEFLGANVPFGTLQIGPQTRGEIAGKGYNYNDSIITGFILSYTGEGKETPTISHDNDIRFFPSAKNEHEAKFVHSYEVVKPGYYSIYMHETDIAAELTATRHTVFQRYFFPPQDSVQVVISRPLTIINDSIATGQTPGMYFIIQFSRPIKGALQESANETKLFFDATEEEMLYIKTSVSTENQEDANAKLENELPNWNFEQMATQANITWNEYLIKE